MKSLDKIRKLPHVAFVDDERAHGHSIIVTLKDGWCFTEEPGCGVRGFDTITEAANGTVKSKVYRSATE